MANSPENLHDNRLDFRAPPPSPIATGRRSSVTNDDVLAEFLEHSLRVPDLILPDRVFPRQRSVDAPPKIDFQTLDSTETDSVARILESFSGTGCFQLVNHGIPCNLIRSVTTAAAGVFRISPEKKATVSRSQEKIYGFEEIHEEDESEMSSEEFVWGRDENLKLEMEGIWPLAYSNFSEKMEILLSDIEKVANKILLILKENSLKNSKFGNEMIPEQEVIGTICHLYKHYKTASSDRWAGSLRYDVIRMLIRGFDCSHSLCLHVCNESSEFHIYSKKGWISFCPDKDALLVTIGDQMQAWSGGQYKHVIGRPIFKGENHKDGISMAFLYSPPTIFKSSNVIKREKTISLGHQAILAILLSLAYYFLVYIYKKF